VNRALVTAVSGMAAQQAVLDSIAADLSNVDVVGYRASRPEFAAMLAPDGSAVGVGAPDSQRLFTQGRIDETDDPYDVAIDGDGLFAVTTADGATAYTRAGNFTPDARGHLTLPNGAMLIGVRLPRGTTSITIAADGSVRAAVAGKAGFVRAGNIRLHDFADKSALRLGDDGLLYATSSAGAGCSGSAGADGFGRIKQRALERANVSVAEAMMAILTAQRAYEANAKAVQAADEMLRLANNLERG